MNKNCKELWKRYFTSIFRPQPITFGLTVFWPPSTPRSNSFAIPTNCSHPYSVTQSFRPVRNKSNVENKTLKILICFKFSMLYAIWYDTIRYHIIITYGCKISFQHMSFIWHDTWHDIWHDMIWYDIWYDMTYDMTYAMTNHMTYDMTWYMTWHMIYDIQWFNLC